MAGLAEASNAVTRAQLEHLIRASAAIAGVDAVVVVGSQAILAAYPDAPQELLVSMVADLYPPDDPRKADVIDGAIGEESPSHEEFGYYAHGVGPETAVLPLGWRDRAIEIRNEGTRFVRGICPSPPDLAVSKLAAGRPRNIDYVKALVRGGLVEVRDIRRVAGELDPMPRSLVEGRLRDIA